MTPWRKIEDFFLRPATALPLAVLRICLGLALLAQAVMLRTSIDAFFAHDGIIQGDLAQALADPGLPRLSWLMERLAPFHVSELSVIHWACGAYFLGLVFLILGVFGRPLVAFVWFLHWTLENTGQTTSYGVDLYTHVFLFYLMIFPSSPRQAPSSMARLGLRVMQLQLCITYLCSAVEKASGIQWWNGEVMWRSLTLPVYQQFEMHWIAFHPWLPTIAGISSLFLELGYFVFIWPKKTRKLWVLGIIGLHLGIAVLLGLSLFGAVMALLTFSLFSFSAEPVGNSVFLFDGVCNLCNGVAAFVLRRDPGRKVRLLSLQSADGQAILTQNGLPTRDFTSLVFVKNGRAVLKSQAVAGLLEELPGAWPIVGGLLGLIPPPLADVGYSFIARRRYRLFGKSDACEWDPSN